MADGVPAPWAFALTGCTTRQSSPPSGLGRLDVTPSWPGERTEDGTCQSAFLRQRCSVTANDPSPGANCVPRRSHQLPAQPLCATLAGLLQSGDRCWLTTQLLPRSQPRRRTRAHFLPNFSTSSDAPFGTS